MTMTRTDEQLQREGEQLFALLQKKRRGEISAEEFNRQCRLVIGANNFEREAGIEVPESFTVNDEIESMDLQANRAFEQLEEYLDAQRAGTALKPGTITDIVEETSANAADHDDDPNAHQRRAFAAMERWLADDRASQRDQED